MKILSICLISFFSFTEIASALVDYTPSQDLLEKLRGEKLIYQTLKTHLNPLLCRILLSRVSNMFYFLQDTTRSLARIKYDQYNLGVTFMTPWKIYTWMWILLMGGTNEGRQFSLGNTEISAGATWLEFGVHMT